MGWDKLREETFARQKALGVVPQDCDLTARHVEIPAWDDVEDSWKPVLEREMKSTPVSYPTRITMWAALSMRLRILRSWMTP